MIFFGKKPENWAKFGIFEVKKNQWKMGKFGKIPQNQKFEVKIGGKMENWKRFGENLEFLR